MAEKSYTIDEPPTQSMYIFAQANLPTIQLENAEKISNELADQLGNTPLNAGTLVQLRWANKICLCCHNVNRTTKFIPCKKCMLCFYCSDACKEKDGPVHDKECCNKDVKTVRYGLNFTLFNMSTKKYIVF